MGRDSLYGGLIVIALAAFLGIVAIRGSQQKVLGFFFGPPQDFTINNPITEIANAISCALFNRNCQTPDVPIKRYNDPSVDKNGKLYCPGAWTAVTVNGKMQCLNPFAKG